MWLLVIVLLSNVPGLDKIMKLNTYATPEECQIERNRIGYEMAAAYPYERDFVIACQLSPKHDSNVRLKGVRLLSLEPGSPSHIGRSCS